MRALSLLVVAAIAGCGPATAKPTNTPAAPAAPDSPGAKCVAQASAARHPKPGAPESIEVAHILVRDKDSPHADASITRTREQACLRALDALHALQGGAEWDATVEKYSDAPGATHGGLGDVKRGDLDPAFADAAFALDVNELSYVVETKAGFHVIVRTR